MFLIQSENFITVIVKKDPGIGPIRTIQIKWSDV